MSRDHIIPQFILRGFAINPTANKQNQKIMIYDKATKQVHTKKIADTYSLLNFNSPETEKYLANEYESKVLLYNNNASVFVAPPSIIIFNLSKSTIHISP